MPSHSFIKRVYPSEGHPLPDVWDSRPFGIPQAVVVSGLSKRIYVTGQAALNVQGELQFPGDKARQMEICFQNIEAILRGLGASFDDVVQCNILVANYDPASDTEPLLPIWSRYLKAQIASTLYGVQSFVLPGMAVEIDAMAEVPLKH